MVCRECGHAFDLSPRYREGFRAALKRGFGFEPEVGPFAIGGVCAECAAANGPEMTGSLEGGR